MFSSTSALFFPLFLFSGFLSVRFRSKYHPDEASRRKAEAHGALENRLNVYMFLMDNGWFDSVSLDIERAQQITKILDAGMENLICMPVINEMSVIKVLAIFWLVGCWTNQQNLSNVNLYHGLFKYSILIG